MPLQAAERLFLRNAGIRHAVHMILEQVPLVLRRQVAVMRYALIVRMSHQIHDIFLQIGARAGDNLHLVPADHLGERDAQLGRAHRAAQRDHHLAAGVDMGFVSFRGVDQGRRVEMAVMMRDKL